MQKERMTKSAFVWTYLLNTPFWALFSMLPFILYRDLGADQWQITLVIALKPMVALFSLYWSAHVKDRTDRLKANIIAGTVIGHFPFLLFPIVYTPWFIVASVGICMMLQRGVIPAWMEVMKRNIPDEPRQKLFAHVLTLSYLGNALFPLFFGWFMDQYEGSWKWIFPITALISSSAIFLQSKLPIEQSQQAGTPIRKTVTDPWRHVIGLLRSRPDFLRYQIGFMLSGCGLMVIQPALPKLFMNRLDLSYTELGLAVTVCKGIGYAMTSQAWASWMNRVNIFRVISLVAFFTGLFPLALLAAGWHQLWVYVAYLGYGVMQAGSELSWKLGGPIFAKNDDSSLYSSVNVLSVGIRGCFAPFLGSLILYEAGVVSVMIFGFILCLASSVSMFLYSQSYEAVESH